MLYHKLLEICHRSIEFHQTYLKNKMDRAHPKGWEEITHFPEYEEGKEETKENDEKTSSDGYSSELTSYLTLPSLATHSIDEAFHKDMSSIFNRDEETMVSKNKQVAYAKIPIKEIKGGKIEDGLHIGCSLVFENCQECVKGIVHFQNALEKRSEKEGPVKRIVRLRNTLSKKKCVFPHFVKPPPFCIDSLEKRQRKETFIRIRTFERMLGWK